MSVVVYPSYIFNYFGNGLDLFKVRNLCSYSITYAISHIENFVEKHSTEYKCHCLKCQVYRELIKELNSRGYENLVFVKNRSGFVFIVLV